MDAKQIEEFLLSGDDDKRARALIMCQFLYLTPIFCYLRKRYDKWPRHRIVECCDKAQEVLLERIKRGTFEQRGDVGPFLWKVATRIAKRSFVKWLKEKPLYESDLSVKIRLPKDPLLRQELFDAIRDFRDGLPPREREVFTRVFEDACGHIFDVVDETQCFTADDADPELADPQSQDAAERKKADADRKAFRRAIVKLREYLKQRGLSDE
jgi:DNA-directed RNA polymerase specialized sigma24 family protein